MMDDETKQVNWKRLGIALLVGLCVIALVAWVGYLTWMKVLPWAYEEEQSWLGLTEYVPTEPGAQREKTLWDLMDLLLVPLAVALATIFFNWRTNAAQRKVQDQRSKSAQKAADEHSHEASLQAYLGQMSELILEEDLCRSAPDADVCKIARARTLTTLQQVDGQRKGAVLRFLLETSLIGRATVVDLKGADLSNIELRDIDLSNVDLEKANLTGGELHGVILVNARLEGAVLCKATLRDTRLCDGNLREADLREAILYKTDLSGADLYKADLRKASLWDSDLTRANLTDSFLNNANMLRVEVTGATLDGANFTRASLTATKLDEAASLEGMTMPDGKARGG